nr:hypothetical protein [Kibdelosporangium sp. MJ126-NF4]
MAGPANRLTEHANRLTDRMEAQTASLKRPYAELRQQVHHFAEGTWGSPTAVVQLGEVKPGFTVPGRRDDGTVKGKRLIRRFFWNIIRGVINAVLNVFTLVNGGATTNAFTRTGTVTGPANGQVLGLVDAARRARSAWLVYTESYVAVIDSGSEFKNPNPPPLEVLWFAEKPNVPAVNYLDQRAVWPDGSEFRYDVSAEQAGVLRQEHKDWLWRNRQQRGN